MSDNWTQEELEAAKPAKRTRMRKTG